MHRLLLGCSVALWVGCTRSPEAPATVPELRDIAVAARQEAEEANDPKMAAAAATRAEEAAGQAARTSVRRVTSRL